MILSKFLQYLTESSTVDKALSNKSKKTGISKTILKKVYNRGLAAWRTGHLPGVTQHQWAMARVNSFATKGKGTWGGSDSDLAKKVNEEIVKSGDKWKVFPKKAKSGKKRKALGTHSTREKALSQLRAIEISKNENVVYSFLDYLKNKL